MPATRRGTMAATVLGLTLALGACGGGGAPTGAASEAPPAPATQAPATTAPGLVAGSSPTDLLPSLSAPPQGIVTTSSFVVGDLVACRVTDVKPLLVLLDASGRRGVIRGAAYEKVQVGDRVIVQITSTDGRFEAQLVHVSNKG